MKCGYDDHLFSQSGATVKSASSFSWQLLASQLLGVRSRFLAVLALTRHFGLEVGDIYAGEAPG